MALTIDDIVACAFQGVQEFEATSGAPTVVSAPSGFNSTYACLLDASGEYVQLDDRQNFNIVGDPSSPYLCTFRIRIADTTPASPILFLEADEGGVDLWTLTLESDGDILVSFIGGGNETITAPLSDATTHKIDIYWEMVDSGRFTMYIDDSEELNVTGKDMSNTGGAGFSHYRFMWASSDTYVSEMVLKSEASSISDRPASTYGIEGPYANTAEDATDQGDALDIGTWANVSEIPVNESNDGQYTGDPKAGHMRTDEGSLSGPNNALTAYAAKWLWWAERGGGGATTHTMRFGVFTSPSTESYNTYVISLGTSPAYYGVLSESSSYIPNASSEYFIIGKEVSGGRNWQTYEAVACRMVDFGGASITINASAGVLTATGQIASIQVPNTISASAGITTLTGQVANVQAPEIVNANPGVITLTGQTADIKDHLAIVASVGVVAATGQTASIVVPNSVGANPGTLIATGQTSTILVPNSIGANVGIATLTGQIAIITSNTVINANVGTLIATGQLADIITPYAVSASVGIVTLTGQTATIGAGVSIAANPGIATLTGQTATINIDLSVDANVGILTATGQIAQVGALTIINVNAGTLTATGQQATIDIDLSVDASVGILIATGQTTSILVPNTILANASSLVATGQTADIEIALSVDANAGIFTLTGQQATIGAGLFISANAGVVTFTGQIATLIVPISISANASTLTATGQLALILAPQIINANVGVLTAIGLQAEIATFIRDIIARIVFMNLSPGATLNANPTPTESLFINTTPTVEVNKST